VFRKKEFEEENDNDVEDAPDGAVDSSDKKRRTYSRLL
jgi:hypothetical protein